MTSIQYPNQTGTVTYNYDELDRLQSIPGFVTSCSYDLDNKLTDMLFANGINNHFDYRSNDDKLANISVGPSGSLLNLNYSYDNVGNITRINGDYYSYDGLNRLKWAGDQSVRRTGNGTLWFYDGAGNRTSHTTYANSVEQENVNYTYDLANRLWSKGTTNYSNSSLGERLTKTEGTVSWTYQYDGESRLVRALNNGTIVTENTYDGSGMRVKKIEDGKTVYFVYNGNDPIVEYEAGDSKYTYYVYAGKRTVAEESNGIVKYYHKDHLGSTRVVTDALGAKIKEYTYEPFGKVITGADGEQSFTGKKQDSTGLFYFGARFYDPEIGRFITADTYTNLPNDERILLEISDSKTILLSGVCNPHSHNRYSYCNNNPLGYTDPDGRFAIAAAPIAVAVAFVGAALLAKVAEPIVNEIAKEIYKAISETNYEDCDDYQDSRNQTKDRMRSSDAKKREKKQVDDALGKDRSKREKASKDLHKDKEGGGNDRNKSYKELKDYNENGTNESNEGGQTGNGNQNGGV